MRLEREQPFNRMMLLVSLMGVVVMSSYLLTTFANTETLKTEWRLSFAGADEFFQTGQAIDFHLFLEDEVGNPVENVDMSVVFDRPDTVHQIEKTFGYLENGLYETEVVFSVPGTWIAMVEAKKDGNYYRNQILFQVDGSIISEANRDPKDSFHLNQPLPEDLQIELNNIPVFRR
ncbi:FixH family protein [Halalkalibacter kiskunsagensis]|uniref:FixH family protein n=1 Tax=Halalkalibacter kiskunsagensis TaxID=1548599 RepID=A0ABV6KGD1_9BACI